MQTKYPEAFELLHPRAGRCSRWKGFRILVCRFGGHGTVSRRCLTTAGRPYWEMVFYFFQFVMVASFCSALKCPPHGVHKLRSMRTVFQSSSLRPASRTLYWQYSAASYVSRHTRIRGKFKDVDKKHAAKAGNSALGFSSNRTSPRQRRKRSPSQCRGERTRSGAADNFRTHQLQRRTTPLSKFRVCTRVRIQQGLWQRRCPITCVYGRGHIL